MNTHRNSAGRAARTVRSRRARRILCGIALAAAGLVMIPVVAEAEAIPVQLQAREELALISKIDVKAVEAQEAADQSDGPDIRLAELAARKRIAAAAQARVEAEAQAKAVRAAAAAAAAAEQQQHSSGSGSSSSTGTSGSTSTTTGSGSTSAPAPAEHNFTVVAGSTDRTALQHQVFTSTLPVDASAFYGSPFIVWDRAEGGLTFPQTAGSIVHLTGAITGTFRVDGILQYITSTTTISHVARGTSLTFQVCDPVLGHDHMHIIGLTRIG
ncbi:MAG: hypothetical protein FWF16_01455 [Microbacteriaceae bacterium]|nr:hypothetical protein [Microbacteriaceae bacterium]